MRYYHTFWCLFTVLVISFACVRAEKRTTEVENNELKQAAYAYNFEFVKKKKQIHQLSNLWVSYIEDSLSNKRYTNEVKRYDINLNLNKQLDTLQRQSVLSLGYLDQRINEVIRSTEGLVRVYFVSLDGWFASFPKIDEDVYPVDRTRVEQFFVQELLDTALVDYGLWYPEVMLDPIVNQHVRTYRQGLVVNNALLGWIVVQASLDSDLELLKSFGSDYIISDYDGEIAFIDESASSVLALPINTKNSLKNQWTTEFNPTCLNVKDTRISIAKEAVDHIISDNSELERFKVSKNQVILIAADMSEIRSKLIRVID